MPKLNYDQLILNASEGDKESLGILYDDLYKGIFALCFAVTKDFALSEDAVQETFIKVRLYGGSVKASGQGRAWIYKVAKNICLNLVKSSKRLVPERDEDYPDPHPYEEALIDSVVLKNAMSALSDKERQVVILHAVSGMRHKEIALIMSVPAGTVKWRYSAALKKLQKVIGNDYQEATV